MADDPRVGDFDTRLQRVLDRMAAAGYRIKVVSRNRTAAQQKALFDKGKATTLLDGTTKVSHHQVGTGADLAFVSPDGKIDWDTRGANKARWDVLGQVAEEEGLFWGGRWKEPYDPGHLQLGQDLPTVTPPPASSAASPAAPADTRRVYGRDINLPVEPAERRVVHRGDINLPARATPITPAVEQAFARDYAVRHAGGPAPAADEGVDMATLTNLTAATQTRPVPVAPVAPGGVGAPPPEDPEAGVDLAGLTNITAGTRTDPVPVAPVRATAPTPPPAAPLDPRVSGVNPRPSGVLSAVSERLVEGSPERWLTEQAAGVVGGIESGVSTATNWIASRFGSAEKTRETAQTVLPIAGGTLGGIAGARGGWRGAMAGGSTGAMLGEAASMGVEALTGAPPPPEDIIRRTTTAGASGAFGELGAQGAVGAIRFAARSRAKLAPGAGELVSRLGIDNLTPGQLSDSDMVQFGENVARHAIGGRHRFADADAALQTRLGQERLGEVGKFGGPISREEAGRTVQGALRQAPGVTPPPTSPARAAAQQQAQAARSAMSQADQQALQQVEATLDRIGRVGPRPAGEAALTGRQRAVEAMRAQERELYGAFEREAGGTVVEEAPRLDDFARQLLGREKGNVAPGQGLRAAQRLVSLFGAGGDEAGEAGVAAFAGGRQLDTRGLPAEAHRIIREIAEDVGAQGDEAAEPLTAVQFQRTVSSLGKITRQLERAARTDPSKNADLGMAKKLLQLARADLDEVLQRDAPAAYEALTKATGFSREENLRLFNENVRRLAKTDPEQILGLVLRKDRSTAIEQVRGAIGDSAWKQLEAAAVTRLVRPNAKTGRVEWNQVLSRIDALGDDTLAALDTQGEIGAVRNLARMVTGHADAAAAAQKALRGLRADTAAPSPEVKFLRKLVTADPDAVVSLITKAKRPAPITLVREAIGPKAFRAVQAQTTEELLRDLPKLTKSLDDMGKDTLRALYPNGEDAGIWELSRIMDTLGRKKAGTGSIYIQLATAGAISSVVGGVGTFVATGDLGKTAAAAATGPGVILLGPQVLAKIMLSPGGKRWLTEGLKLGKTEAGARATMHLTAWLAKEGLIGRKQAEAALPATPQRPPDNPFGISKPGPGVAPPPANPFGLGGR